MLVAPTRWERYNVNMARRIIPFVEGEFFHVYNRGNSKQLIFRDDADRDRFVKLLYLCNSKKDFKFREDIVRKNIDAFDFERGDPLVSIGAWTLMPNHFHLYLTSCSHPVEAKIGDEEKSNVSVFMHKLTNSYSHYFNIKYKRTGGLFEERFKAAHIISDNQAKYLFSYIHLNPVKLIQKDWKEKGIRDIEEALEYLAGYMWSSYADFKGEKRVQNKVLNIEKFPEYFPNISDFDKEILDWITIKAAE